MTRVALLGVVTCFFIGQDTHPGSRLTVKADSALFHAVVRSVVASDVPTWVNRRPLIADPSVTVAEQGAFAPDSLLDPATRVAVLRALRVRDTNFVDSGDCPGAFALTSEALAKKAAHCPARLMHLVSIGLPRKGGAYHPSSSFDERSDGAARDVWATRVVHMTLSPNGSVIRVLDVVAERSGSDWRLVKTVTLLILE
jgi:hypothetical protein